MNPAFNLYGDSPKFIASGHGADIASQRADDLDLLALTYVKNRKKANTPTYAVDIGCGEGGQSIRMAQAGAQVLAIDIIEGKPVLEKIDALGLHGNVNFLQRDMRDLCLCASESADVIICQRAVHYLQFYEAVGAVSQMRRMLRPGGNLYISASGISSELGDDYLGHSKPRETRYDKLTPLMSEKHGIHAPVCLYSEDDMKVLLCAAGLAPNIVFSSSFGNIKAVATNV